MASYLSYAEFRRIYPEMHDNERSGLIHRKLTHLYPLFLCFFLLIFFFFIGGACFSITAEAAPSTGSEPPALRLEDYLNERLEFDSEGNLFMTTRDKIATSAITYKTIGWTIKRYNGGIFEAWNECAYISLVSLSTVPDPEDSRYCYTTFYCDKNTIFNAIGAVSADWQESLYRNGGTVWLDAIMTVCHNGVPLGALTTPPSYTGQVYFYYDDIAAAEHWANPESLISHFNKSVAFPANPGLLQATTYIVTHMECTSDNQMLSLSRYGKDTSGSLKDWTSHSFPYSDFSAHYYNFDHSFVRVTYYDGHYDDLAYASASPVTISNPTGQIAHISISYYYRRVNQDEYIWQRYLLTEDGQLDTAASAFTTASERNLENHNENYDVTKGIPSGSYVNLLARVSPFAYEARFRHCFGEFTCSVPILTTYRLVWSDSSGSHEETVTLNETYYVDRKFSFYCLSNYTIYTLQNVLFLQNALEHTMQSVSNITSVNCTIQQDANTAHHYTLPTTAPLILDGGTLTGDRRRPTPPLNAMQNEAETAIGAIQVQNDLLQIDNFLLLTNTLAEGEASIPILPSNDLLTDLTKSDCLIPEVKPNSANYETFCTACYKSISSETTLKKQFKGNSIVVHTPVLCDTQISDGKKWNQQLNPNENYASLILGRSFSIRTNCEGMHVNLPGYGNRNYSEYVKEIRVRFPFPVYLDDTLLPENLWHTVSAESQLYLPTGVPEGLYTVELRILAKNTPETQKEQQLAALCEEGANLERSHTIATRTIPVCVTGRLFDFSFSIDNSVYHVGNKDKDGEPNGNSLKTSLPAASCPFYTELPFSLKTIGTPPSKTAYLELVPTFYHVDENGQNRQPVDLYLLAEDNTLKKYSETLRLSSQAATASGSTEHNVATADTAIKSVQTWNGTFLLPEPLIIVPAGTELSDSLEEKGSLSLKDSEFLQKGFLLINFSITYQRSSLPVLSYINHINAEKGYCNMWKTEGFTYKRTDAARNTWQFIDGDSLLFSVEKNRKIYTTH